MKELVCPICSEKNKKIIDRNSGKCLFCKEKLNDLKEKHLSNTDDKNAYDEYIKFKDKYEKEFVKVKSKIYWCDKCKTPTINKKCNICGSVSKYISSDCRPVFLEEKLLISILFEDFSILNKSAWYLSNYKYLIDGKKYKINRNDFLDKDPKIIIKELEKNKNRINGKIEERFQKQIDKFILANKNYLNEIKTYANEDIKKISENYHDDEIFISISGGKDSTVVSDLVLKALAGRNIIRIFGDTTLENEYTYDYIKRQMKDNTYNSDIYVAKNRKDDFYKLSSYDQIGPPSRVLSWCCTFFKTSPISDKLDTLFKGKDKILSFHGIRRVESVSRSKYSMSTENSKLSKQFVFAPIIDWLDFDVWLYILSEKIDFNYSYKLGYGRVGCWCCPNNNRWSEFLSSIYFNDINEKWLNQLLDFAIKTEKYEPEKYVKEGSWKARQGGNGLEKSDNIFVNFSPCVDDEKSFTYELKKPITKDLYELFKPFGYINYEMGNKRKGEVYVLNKDKIPVLRLQGRIGNKLLKVSILNLDLGGISRKIKNIVDAKKKIECQLVKYQLCTGCNGCKTTCKYDAISINYDKDGNIKYEIDSEKCVRCGKCIDYYDNGCYMKKVLRVKEN
jgi:phosphoadenosine phosphosulfate reductase